MWVTYKWKTADAANAVSKLMGSGAKCFFPIAG